MILARPLRTVLRIVAPAALAVGLIHCDGSREEPTAPEPNFQAEPVVTDRTPRQHLDLDDILSALADPGQSDGTLLIAVKEPAAVRGVGKDGVVLPVEARYAAENAIRLAFPDLTVQRGVRRIIESRTPTGIRVDTLHRTYIAVQAPRRREMLEALRNDPHVDFIQPDYTNGGVASDAAYDIGVVTTMRRRTQTKPWGVDAVRAPDAWNAGYTGQGINVGMVDSGADLEPVGHPDLAWAGLYGMFTNFTAQNADDPCQSFQDPCWWEQNFHGTGVIGAAMALDNADGSVGAAPANTTPILTKATYRVGANQVLHEQDFADAVLHVTNNWNWFTDPVRVAVTSIAFPDQEPHQILHNAFMIAAGQNNVLWFAAAGNGYGGFVMTPARFDEVVAVSAQQQNLNIAGFSSIGPEVELTAPGANMRVSWNRQGDDTGAFEFTSVQSGTSFAAPTAAGVARIAMDKFPSWTASQLRSEMQNHARDLGAGGRDNLFGYGMVDAPCLIYQESPCVPLTVLISGPSVLAVGETGTWTRSVSGSVLPYSYKWYWDSALVGTASSYTRTMEGPANQNHTVKLEVTSASGQKKAMQRNVLATDGGCPFPPCEES